MTLDSRLSKGTLIKGLLGILPIPIVGEVGLSMFFYELLKDRGEMRLEYTAIPAALLTRFMMYRDIYFPFYDRIIGN